MQICILKKSVAEFYVNSPLKGKIILVAVGVIQPECAQIWLDAIELSIYRTWSSASLKPFASKSAELVFIVA